MSTATDSRDRATHHPLAAAFIARSHQLIQELAESASSDLLSQALAAGDAASGLAHVLAEVGPIAPPPPDPLRRARARAALAKQELFADAGGAYRVSEVANLLGISRQAVDARRNRGTLLAVQHQGDEWVYPACQFTEDGVIPGLARFLTSFRAPSPWTQLSVLLAESTRLGGLRPLDALLAGDVEAAIHVASQYGEHAA